MTANLLLLMLASFSVLAVFVRLVYPIVLLDNQVLFEFDAKVELISVFDVFQYLHPRRHVNLNLKVNDLILHVFVHMSIEIVNSYIKHEDKTKFIAYFST